MDKIISNYILVIEDEPTINKTIVEQLTSTIDHSKIKTTSTIKEALSLLNVFAFDIIILDLNLKDGNGISVINKLKKENLKSLIYIFSINSELKKICLKKGATAFFDKSKDFDKLISTVKLTYSDNSTDVIL